MAAMLPFLPDVKSGATGKSQLVTVNSTGQKTIVVINSLGLSPTLQINYYTVDATVVPVYMRLSVESSTVITASNTDTPLVVGPDITAVRLFANPAPNGQCSIAFIATVAPSTGVFITVTPGEGGV